MCLPVIFMFTEKENRGFTMCQRFTDYNLHFDSPSGSAIQVMANCSEKNGNVFNFFKQFSYNCERVTKIPCAVLDLRFSQR